MDRVEQLIEAYQTAEGKIKSEIEKAPKGTEREYQDSLLKNITAILFALYAFTESWSNDNIWRIYEDGLNDSYAAVDGEYRAAGKEPPDFGAWTTRDELAANTAKTKFNAYLTDAINTARQHMQSEIQKAAMQATEEAILKGQRTQAMQDNLIKMLADRGIEAVPYVRSGKQCYMQLSSYAELVARTTEHEIRNTANLNLGARIGNDLVHMSEHWGSCPICAPYQGRVYSISGADTRYPYLYSTPWSMMYQNFHPRCRHVLTQWIEALHTPEENERMQAYSNRSFEIGGDGWTKKQTQAAQKSLASYRQREERIRSLYTDRKQYERYQAVLGADAPKTFSAFRRMKTENGSAWKNLQQEYRKFNDAIALQNQLSFVYNVNKEFIPQNALITNVKTIAGARVKRKIDVIDGLIAEYGGMANEWTKKVGKVESSKYIFDIHWYEKNGVQYQAKIKYVKEKE